MTALIRLILVCTFFTLTACGTGYLKPNSSDVITENNQNTKATPSKDITKLRDFNLNKDTLYDLIVAEVAAQRNQFNITLVNYILQARITRDPEIIKRAINAAQLLKDVQAIQEMALLWIDVDEKSIPAHQLLAFQYTLQKNYQDAIAQIEVVLNLGGEARVDSLAIGSQQLPENDRLEILELYKELYSRHPENNEIGYSLALVQRNLKQFNEAQETLNPILNRNPEFEAAIVLKVNILYDLGQLKEALELADDQYDNFPANHNLGRLFASMLIEDKQLDKAESVFEDLVALYPQAPSLKLSYALVMLENDKVDPAKITLLELLDAGVHQNEANFYLGRIADLNKNFPNAIKHYQQVKRSSHFEAALERSSFLLAKEEGKIDEAIDYLNGLRTLQPDLSLKLWLLQFKLLSTLQEEDRALKTLDLAIIEFPKDEQLLYARAMNREMHNDLTGMESDLRIIIENNPNHAVALNALGYTLANRTDRLEESFTLIKAALTLKPDNPMILDSMGWVLFKLEKQEEALIFLLKAFQTYPDGEVAAHLGEVLWALGKQNEAQAIWHQSLQKNPKHTALIKTIERFLPYTAPPEDIKESSQPENQPDTETTPEDKH